MGLHSPAPTTENLELGKRDTIKQISRRGPGIGQKWQVKKIPSAFASTGIWQTETVNVRHHGLMQETEAEEEEEEEEGNGKCLDPSAAPGDSMSERIRGTRGRPERKEEGPQARPQAGP